MNEKLMLNIDDLSMRNPGYNLINEHFLTFSQNYGNPFLEPLVPLLIHFPQDVDDNPSSVLLRGYSQHDLPYFLEDQLILCRFSPDVAKGEVPIPEEIALNAQDEVFVLLNCLPEALCHCFAIDAGILLEVSIRGLSELIVDELDDLRVVVAHLRNFVDEVGLGGSEDG